MEQQLSTNFKLSEFINSDVATANKITEQFNPPQTIIDNITQLVTEVLQPIRSKYNKPITVNSGYRCAKLNDKVKGSKSSAHLQGLAADITTGTKAENKQLYQLIVRMINDNEIVLDQLISEYGFSWLHLGIKSNAKENRNMIFKLS